MENDRLESSAAKCENMENSLAYIKKVVERILVTDEDCTPQANENMKLVIHNEAMQYKQDILARIYAKYPYFFVKDISISCDFPVGWVKGLEQAFDKFAATGVNVLVHDILFMDGTVQAITVEEILGHRFKNMDILDQFHAGTEIITSFLESISETCVLCASQCQKKDDSIIYNLCPQCEMIFSSTTTCSEKKEKHCNLRHYKE